MDALKRAELAKQQGQGDPASELSMAPDTPESGAALPNLPKLEDLDEEFMADTGRPADPVPATEPGKTSASPGRAETTAGLTPRATADRRAVRNAFAAKGGMDNQRKFVLIAAGMGLLAVAGAGAFLWLQLEPVPRPIATKPSASFAASRPNIPPPRQEEYAVPAVRTMPAPDIEPTQQIQPPLSPPVAGSTRSPPPRRAESPAPTTRPAPPLPDPDASIKVTSTHPGIDPAITAGYRLLAAGDLTEARAAYTRALRNDPRQADALHGIAAIALREGKPEEAAIAYQRILESNPSDPAAQAGLIGLNGQGDPVAAESRIKSLLAAQGDLPVLNFALGNLFARQQRWNDAQQAYFKAITGDADNPDYLFNLAVSLDQLHQPKLAAQYYGQALAAANGRSAAFDRGQATQRLHELQP